MSEGPITKKVRVWNPAVEEDASKYAVSSKSSSPTQDNSFDDSDNSADFAKIANPILPMFLQNYLNIAPFMARMQQQQQQMENLMRQRLMNPPTSVPTQVKIQKSAITPVIPQSVPPPVPSSVSAVNPLVASAMGAPAVNENCCAICGAVFRLTTDLVQHMRNNHRRSRFKRKNEKCME
ncbi:unnamed protein product [Auanema sp. JU1783]|nr:unnamed protein product [Auanema sp. JU1783]